MEKGTGNRLGTAFGTFMIPVFSGAFYEYGLLVQARGQLVLTMRMVPWKACFVNRPAETPDGGSCSRGSPRRANAARLPADP